MKIFNNKTEFYDFLNLSEISQQKLLTKKKYFLSIQTQKMRIFRSISIFLFYVFLRLLVIPTEAFLVTETNVNIQLYDSLDTIISQVSIIIGFGLIMAGIMYYLISKQFFKDINIIESIQTCLHKEKEKEDIFMLYETCLSCKYIFISSGGFDMKSKIYREEESLKMLVMSLLIFFTVFFTIDFTIQRNFVPSSIFFVIFELFAIPSVFFTLYYNTKKRFSGGNLEQINEIIIFLMIMALILIILFPIGVILSEIMYTL
jgi:hypothetical protein